MYVYIHWILDFKYIYIIIYYIIRVMDSWSEHHEAGGSMIHTAPHKEEGTNRRQLDATYQAKIVNELSKHVIPLATHDTPFCNIIRSELHQL